MEKLEVICGIPKYPNTENVLNNIHNILKRRDKELHMQYCRNKLEVEQAVFMAKKNSVVLLQETLEMEAPYQAHELAAIRDIRSLPVVVSVSKIHFGTSFLSILYAAGILDAVYEEEAIADTLAERLVNRRNRKICREYYGISNIEEPVATLSILSEETVSRYINHISGISTEIRERYLQIQERLNFIENCYLVKQLPEDIIKELKDNGVFLQYCEQNQSNWRKNLKLH